MHELSILKTAYNINAKKKKKSQGDNQYIALSLESNRNRHTSYNQWIKQYLIGIHFPS